MVSSILAAQAGNTQQQVATTILSVERRVREKSAVQTLLGAGTRSLANVAAGIGGNINVTA